MTFRSTTTALCALLAAAASNQNGTAQCGRNVTFSSLGGGCPIGGQVATLSGQVDLRACTMQFSLSFPAPPAGTTQVQQLLLIGIQSIEPALTHPLFASGCALSVAPLAIAPAPRLVPWTFRIPRVRGPVQLYFQGMNHYFTPSTGAHQLQTSRTFCIGLAP